MKNLLLIGAMLLMSSTAWLQLSGPYEVDAGGGGDYLSLAAFAADLNTLGVSGPVDVSVVQGTYTGAVGFNAIAGASATNLVSIHPHVSNTAPVVIENTPSSSTEGVIKFDGCQFVSINGLTVNALGTTYGRTIYVTGATGNIEVSNCLISVGNLTTSSTFHSGIYATSWSPTTGCYMTFNNNTIDAFYGYYMLGSSSTSIDNSMTITNNTINVTAYAVYVTYQDFLTVTDNDMNIGLHSSTQYGVYCTGSTSAAGQNNVAIIRNNNIKGNTTGTFYGVYIQYFNGLGGTSEIINNMISNENTDISTGARYGIYPFACANLNIYHNSISILNGSATSGRAMYFNNTTSTTLGYTQGNYNVRNNIISNLGDGYSLEVSSTGGATANFTTLNNNLYYGNAVNPFRWSNTNYADLASYSAATTYDAASLSGDPLFISSSNLHCLGALANDAGDNTVGVTTDIDGQTRPLAPSTTVDIGADEFAPPSCVPPTAMLTSGTTMTSVNLDWTASSSGPSTSYAYYYSTSNTSPTGGTTPSGTVGAGIVTVNLTGLTPDTPYYWWVRSNCGGSGTSIWVQGPDFFTGYCVPVATNLITWLEDFSTTGGISNISNLGSGMTGTGYADNSATMSVSTVVAGSVNFSLQVGGTGSTGYAIWVDWNNDLVFDASERMANSTSYSTAVQTGSFAVPGGVAVGDYRMRVLIDYLASNPTNPCGFNGTNPRGEAEDYTFSVITPPSCFPIANGTASSILDVSAQINWTPATVAVAGYNWEVRTSGAGGDGPVGLVASGSTVSDTFALVSGLTSQTQYYIYVQTICGPSDLSVWAGGFTFTTGCSPFATLFEDFDSYGTGNIVPTCWERLVPGSGTQSISSSAPASGTRNIYQFSSSTANETYVILPLVNNLDAGTHRFGFKVRSSSTSAEAEVGYITDINDPLTYTMVTSFTGLPSSYDGNYSYVYFPTSGIPAGARIAVRNPGNVSTNIYWDDAKWELIPTCAAPTNLAANATSVSTADLTWDASVSLPADGYQFAVTVASSTPTSPTGSVAAGVLMGTVSGLTDNTTYNYWVRSICGPGDTSAWAVGGTFTTPCAPFTTLFEDFDSYGTGSIVPNCWDRYSPGSGSQTITSTSPASGTRNIYQYSSNSTNQTFVILPAVSNLEDGTHRFGFKVRGSNATAEVEVGYMTNITDETSYTMVQSFTGLPTSYDGSVSYVYFPTSGIPAGARIAVRNPGTSTASIYWDDATWELIPSCAVPVNLSASASSPTTADISWDASVSLPADGYQYYVSTSNVDPVLGTPVTGSVAAGVLTASLTGLTDATTYYYWVRSVCGTGDTSLWTSSSSFATPCIAVATISEDFDSYGTGSIVPTCWDRLVPGSGSQSISSSSPASGTRNIYQFSSNTTNETYVILPLVNNLDAGTHRFGFKVRSTSTAAEAEVGYITDINDPSTFTMVSSFTGLPSTYDGSVSYVYFPTTGIPAGARIAVRNPGNVSTNIYWDDATWDLIPSCAAVTGLSATAGTPTTADISWTASVSAPADGYQYYVSTVNSAPVLGTVATGSVAAGITTVNVTGLTDATTYYYWVRGVCGAGDTSLWAGGDSFTTPCLPIAAPWLETFTTTSTPVCWSQSAAAGGPWVFTGSPGYSVSGVQDHTTGSGINYAWMDFSVPDAGVILETPIIDVSALTTPELRFFMYSYATGSNSVTIYNQLFVEAYDGSAWTQVTMIQNDLGNAWSEQKFDVSTYTYGANFVKLRFRAEDGGDANTYWNDLLIDDVEIRETPPASMDLTVFVEGYYISASSPAAMNPVMYNNFLFGGPAANPTDVVPVTVELWPNAGGAAYSATGILADNGSLSVTFPPAAIGNTYWISVTTSNTLRTFSASSVTIAETNTYDFSNAVTQAATDGSGDPMATLAPGLFGLRSGDINQDEFIDGSDYSIFESEVPLTLINFNMASDLNGDGFVDGSDYPIFDLNSAAGYYAQYPSFL